MIKKLRKSSSNVKTMLHGAMYMSAHMKNGDCMYPRECPVCGGEEE